MSVNGQHQTKSREEIAGAYDSPTWWYDIRGFFILTFAYRSSLGRQLRLFGANIAANHLEVAVGSGTLLDLILKWRNWKNLNPGRIVGIDYAETMLAGAIRRFAGREGIEMRHADVNALPFEDETFDSANIANAVHCFPDIDGAFAEVFRVLIPGGRLAANVLLFPRGPLPARRVAQWINDWGMRKGILFSPYEPDDIRQKLAGAGFQLIYEEIAGNTYNVIASKPGKAAPN